MCILIQREELRRDDGRAALFREDVLKKLPRVKYARDSVADSNENMTAVARESPKITHY